MLWRVRSSRGRPKNAPAAFIQPCRPTIAQRPPRGEGWVHELKHDGYRLQIHVRDGRVRLYTMNAADWTRRYPRIVEHAARIKGSAIIDAEVVWLDGEGLAQFDALHSRVMDHAAIACAFDLLMLDGDDLRRRPLSELKAALRKLLRRSKGGIQYVEHVEGDGAEMFAAVCKLGLEGVVSKRLTAPYRSGPSKSWSDNRRLSDEHSDTIWWSSRDCHVPLLYLPFYSGDPLVQSLALIRPKISVGCERLSARD